MYRLQRPPPTVNALSPNDDWPALFFRSFCWLQRRLVRRGSRARLPLQILWGLSKNCLKIFLSKKLVVEWQILGMYKQFFLSNCSWTNWGVSIGVYSENNICRPCCPPSVEFAWIMGWGGRCCHNNVSGHWVYTGVKKGSDEWRVKLNELWLFRPINDNTRVLMSAAFFHHADTESYATI